MKHALKCLIGFITSIILLVAASPLFAGDFIPPLQLNTGSLVPGINANDTEEGYILPGNGGFQFVGKTTFASAQLEVYGRSKSTLSLDGTGNFHQLAFGASDVDNALYRAGYASCPGRLSRVYRLSIKDTDATGQGNVELEFRFKNKAVRNLHVVVLDVDENRSGKRERVIVNAYSSTSPRVQNKLNPDGWRIVAQGDMSLYNGNRPLQATLPPSWFSIRPGQSNQFGLLQARGRPTATSNQHRDYTILTRQEAVRLVRVDFKGPRGENRARREIGSHVYVGLWHASQACS